MSYILGQIYTQHMQETDNTIDGVEYNTLFVIYLTICYLLKT